MALKKYKPNDHANLTLKGGTMTKNAARYGGALWNNGGNVVFDGCQILENNAECGGGIWNNGEGLLEIKSGNISKNTASTDPYNDPDGRGGGIWNNDNGIINMTGGEITFNKAAAGGGVWCTNGSDFRMSGGVIAENEAYQAGGGIYVAGDVVMNMEGDVDDNIAGYYGGGLYLEHVTRLNFEGNVSFNKAQNGGGIFLNASNMVITGGIIRNNRAVPDPYNPADVTGSVKPSTGYLVNPLLMVGSLDFVGVGGGLYLNSGSNLQFDIQDDLGVYENDATWGAGAQPFGRGRGHVYR